MSGNPDKDSKYGRKLRSGGAITFVNPDTKDGKSNTKFHAQHLTIESLSPTSPPTVSERTTTIANVLELPTLLNDIAAGKAGNLNEAGARTGLPTSLVTL